MIRLPAQIPKHFALPVLFFSLTFHQDSLSGVYRVEHIEVRDLIPKQTAKASTASLVLR